MEGDERSRTREREAVTDRSCVEERSFVAFGLLISERLVEGARVPIRAGG